MKPLRVLSLFDGISCGQVALERANIPVEVYYASEIDKYAIQITQKNYPNTIQLGDINNIDFTQFIGKIDLIMGGSPCQDLSIAGKRAGLRGVRSGLFYKFVEAIEVIKPKYFLLENNYNMPEEAKEEITSLLGVNSLLIDSAFFSAQRRKRLYWSNFNIDMLYTDKMLAVEHILENTQELENLINEVKFNNTKEEYKPTTVRIGTIGNGGQGERVYSIKAKSTNLTAYGGGRGAKTELYLINGTVRKLTPLEAERLQTLPDNYTEGVSNSQRYKCIGNGWTVDVIAHIFENIK
jgi:DNA (cytosine-5)-methyltransferase 3A